MRRNLLLTIDEPVKRTMIPPPRGGRVGVGRGIVTFYEFSKLSAMASWIIVSVILLVTLAFATTSPAAEGPSLKPTLFSMDFYGSIASANPGDLVTVYDEKGTLCGQFTINQEGQYGFLHVYGDDKTTAVHEGADVNGRLTFLLNDAPLVPLSGQELLWLGDGQQVRVDFVRR